MNRSTFQLQLRRTRDQMVNDEVCENVGGAERSPDNAASVLLLFQVAR